MALNEALSDAFDRYGDAPALLSQDGQVLSFAKLGHTVAALATRLRDEGVGPGQCVAIVTDNRALKIALLLALARLGSDVALVSSIGALARRGQKIDSAIRFSDQNAEGAERSIVFSQDWLNTPPDLTMAFTAPGTLVLSTSGSTGAPRYVRIHPQAYVDMVTALPDGVGESIGSVLVSIPETAPFSVFLLLRALLGGHGFAGMSPSGGETLDEAARFGVREMMVTPLALNELVAATEMGAPKGDLARLCVFGSVAEPPLLARAEKAFGCGVYICVGATEIGQTTWGRFDSASYVTGWSGKMVASTEARIGEGGRLLLRSPFSSQVEAYIGGPPAFDAEGWFDTGDIARLTEDGVLMIDGRADNMINLGGSKFAAELIEKLVGQCPGVEISAAVRIQSPGGLAPELGVAVVASANFDAAAARRLLAEKLHTSAHIRIITCPQLPSLPTGKVDRTAVAGLFA
ncbi:class I adenylate-forming enzyme family protein [Terricaulis silvestris]|uniref:class I adenylate-forming enzyme family protein n=1 Tax=Terricaulis silvestris TaxID=2686094 RepID=UPI00131E42F9|nr:class I adenylate-forming enzyme family protein [Terricaulis silvestris]